MARATRIYLVVRHDYDGVDPQAAFTVKHEMITWLKRQPDTTGWGVMSMPDGNNQGAEHFKAFEIKDLLT